MASTPAPAPAAFAAPRWASPPPPLRLRPACARWVPPPHPLCSLEPSPPQLCSLGSVRAPPPPAMLIGVGWGSLHPFCALHLPPSAPPLLVQGPSSLVGPLRVLICPLWAGSGVLVCTLCWSFGLSTGHLLVGGSEGPLEEAKGRVVGCEWWRGKGEERAEAEGEGKDEGRG
ncbi:unnamed protein product [Cyclocybe aegerita]|uniref:Uncharacterized protein n=1 Tax=Cyclocybe aegerita TaxID=1973307 RepID=A0A8S0XUC0_CYCAE|nr:unnamed protein product [Cyclocybe aegerita]